MSIQKKSLISSLQSAKKANVATGTVQATDAKGEKIASAKRPVAKAMVSAKRNFAKSAHVSAKKLNSPRAVATAKRTAKSVHAKSMR